MVMDKKEKQQKPLIKKGVDTPKGKDVYKKEEKAEKGKKK